jgi:hypothetical protein
MTRSLKILHWSPRVLCILAILFISLFALDAFSPELPLWKQITGFLIHLIPSYILIALLVLAWKKEFIGGLLFMIIGLVFTPIIYNHNYAMNHSVALSLWIVAGITIPFVLVGLLFIISHFKKKRQLTS